VAFERCSRPLKKGTGPEQSHRLNREIAYGEVPVSLFQPLVDQYKGVELDRASPLTSTSHEGCRESFLMSAMTCPVCGAAVVVQGSTLPAGFPCCSERCRSIDLGRWLDERYTVPVESNRVVEESLQEDPPPGSAPRLDRPYLN
jgi:endogenous inhibitor of DNA gyrase (YacG/DUF329 family)